MKVSVIVSSKGCNYINYALSALRGQTFNFHETILVVKGCNIKEVEDLCRKAGLSCVVIEQRSGFFTHALNLGKKNATGDLLLYTDDDAIPVKRSRLQEIL
jgi:glycosyltransferase involved in cell wall biosynthesis